MGVAAPARSSPTCANPSSIALRPKQACSASQQASGTDVHLPPTVPQYTLRTFAMDALLRDVATGIIDHRHLQVHAEPRQCNCRVIPAHAPTTHPTDRQQAETVRQRINSIINAIVRDISSSSPRSHRALPLSVAVAVVMARRASYWWSFVPTLERQLSHCSACKTSDQSTLHANKHDISNSRRQRDANQKALHVSQQQQPSIVALRSLHHRTAHRPATA